MPGLASDGGGFGSYDREVYKGAHRGGRGASMRPSPSSSSSSSSSSGARECRRAEQIAEAGGGGD